MKAKVVVFVEAGMVQGIISDQDIECLLIDQDEQDSDQTTEVTYPIGGKFTAAMTEYPVTVNQKEVEHFWKQIPPE